jgi:hypothetical protein
MRFRNIKSWLVSYLGTHATAGGYRVLGYKDDAIDASNLSDSNRLAQVFVKGGDFPKNASAHHGPVMHDVNVSVELLTSATASVDLSVLESETATDGQRAAAIASAEKATALADDDADEFFDTIYQLLMAADQQDLGYPDEVANRWAARWTKGAPIMRGSRVVIPVTIEFGFRTVEDLTGVQGIAPTSGELVTAEIQTTTTEDADPEGGAAVTVGGEAS